jgi:hypothetical protein
MRPALCQRRDAPLSKRLRRGGASMRLRHFCRGNGYRRSPPETTPSTSAASSPPASGCPGSPSVSMQQPSSRLNGRETYDDCCSIGPPPRRSRRSGLPPSSPPGLAGSATSPVRWQAAPSNASGLPPHWDNRHSLGVEIGHCRGDEIEENRHLWDRSRRAAIEGNQDRAARAGPACQNAAQCA